MPEGLPTPTLPDIPLSTWVALVPAAIGIVLVAYSEALGVAREFAAQHGYEIDPDQELIAHGGTNIVSGLLGGMIAGGGMSASAVKEGAGARSQVANFVAWGATIVTLFLLTPLFQSLPQAVLGALIIQAVWHLIVARKLHRLWALARYEWVLGLLTLFECPLLRSARRDDDRPRPVAADRRLPGVAAAISLLGAHPSTPYAFVDLDGHPEAVAKRGTIILRRTSHSGTRTPWRCARRC